MNETETLLKVENLRTTFETEEGVEITPVNGVSFEIDQGETLGIVGESGSGKSVTALSILKLIEDNGTVTADSLEFQGEDLLSKSEKDLRQIRGGDISMIFQDPMSSLNPVITVGEQIAEVARHHGNLDESSGFWSEMKRKYVSGTEVTAPSWRRAVELLEIVGIPEPEKRAKDYPHQLSGGMKQRVMIAQALAGDPSLIIADEPTTALDVTIEAQILNELRDLQSEFGVSIIFITHDLAVIREICDRIVVLYASEVMEKASTEDIFSTPRHPYTEGLLKSIPKITEDRERLDVVEGNVPGLVDRPPGCPFSARCEYAFEMCEEPLESHNVEDEWTVRCHLYHDDVNADVKNGLPSTETKSQHRETINADQRKQ